MKYLTPVFVVFGLILASGAPVIGATNELPALVQRGLFEEEANRNLEGAIQAYRSAINQHDKDRQLLATAIFRLGECYRKQGKTNEASEQYTRVLREFSDQDAVAKQCEQSLGRSFPASQAGNVPSKLSLLQAHAETQKRLDEIEALVTKAQLSDNTDRFWQKDALVKELALHSSELKAKRRELEKAPKPDVQEMNRLGAAIKEIEHQIEKRIEQVRDRINKERELLIKEEARLRQQLEGEIAPSQAGGGGVVLEVGSDALPQTQAITSAEQEEVRRIKAIIQNSPDLINAMSAHMLDRNVAPLHKAAYDGQLVVAEFLLQNKAEVNIKDSTGRTPLHYAAQRGHKAMVGLLLAHKAEIDATDASLRATPLYYATENGYKAVVELLLEHKANPNLGVRTSDWGNGLAPLHIAAEKGRDQLAGLLLAHRADVALADGYGKTPLHWASTPEIAELLIRHKAPIDRTNKVGFTPLHNMAEKGNAKVAAVLLKAGANVNARTEENGSVLDLAIKSGVPEMVQLLLSNKVEVNASGETMPPLRRAVDATVQSLNAYIGYTGNSFKSREERLSIVKMLLMAGADPNVSNDAGETPLFAAVTAGDKALVRLLLEHKANANILNHSGESPLSKTKPFIGMSASRDIFQEIAVMLRKAGANDNLQRLNKISLRVPGTEPTSEVFGKGRNEWNHYTLLETIARAYGPGNPIPFPDLAHVTVVRLQADGTETKIKVDVQQILDSGNGSKDIPLQWGDIIDIPQYDHPVSERWEGMSLKTWTALTQILQRRVRIVVKGQETNLLLLPHHSNWSYTLRGDSASGTNSPARPLSVLDFRLFSVIEWSSQLRSSSDRNRAIVRRMDPVTKKVEEKTFYNPGNTLANDLWLHDGDVIEIPERDPNAPEVAPSGGGGGGLSRPAMRIPQPTGLPVQAPPTPALNYTPPPAMPTRELMRPPPGS